MAVPAEMSEHLLSFLLAQMGGNNQPSVKPARKTTAGLLPGQVAQDTFSGYQVNPTGAYQNLNTIASGIANKRADSDAMHSLRMGKKAEAAAQAAYKKQQAAYDKQQKALFDKLSKLMGQGNNTSTPNVPSYIPPPPPKPSPHTNQPILPKIPPAPKPPVYPDTHIGPAPEPPCPGWKKFLHLC